MEQKPRTVLRAEGLAEFTERKSRFIGHCIPIRDEEEALAFIEENRRAHRSATHNVYAYRLFENNICRHSDDGEPSGTAGLPLLEAFLRREVYDFCCIATRYFGGVLLGAGGLTRAYARSGTVALEAAGLAVLRLWRALRLCCPYALWESIRRLLEAHNAAELAADYAADVNVHCVIPGEQWLPLLTALREISAGTISPIDEGLCLKKV